MFNVNDLVSRYGNVTSRAIRMFVQRNIDKINDSDVEHAKQTIDGWQFDAEAVKRIDELRGFSQIAVVEQTESERIKELREENENLRRLLLIAQSDLIQTQKLLQDNQTKLLTSESRAGENDMALVRIQADLEIEKSKRKIAEEKVAEVKSQLEKHLDESNRQLEKIKNRGLMDRILNRF